jgi:hypothetical protein
MVKIFKEISIYILYKLIEIIEIIEYRKLDLDENNIQKKILKSISLEKTKVLSDTGYEESSFIHITQPYKHYKLTLENGYKISVADNHILFDSNFNQIFVKDLKIGQKIQTLNGVEKVLQLKKDFFKTSMFDLTIEHPNHRFYTNGILSHNTITSSITLLHFILFNNNKNALITANKLETATEVLDKIKEIYQRLPFFLQQGIKKWNEKFISFENKSRAKGFATTKTASIGQTADFLYLDEFAYLPDSIAEKFYKSVFPTVSNIENSKIIITSTPNGYNLFHKLLTDAEKPEDEKSSYTAKRVYWWQVPKRFVTYVRLHEKKLTHFNLTKEDVLSNLLDAFPKNKSELDFNKDLNKWVIVVFNSDDCTEDDVLRHVVNGIKLPELAEVTTWKKQTIKDIGSEESFNQEFELRFLNSSRSLLDEAIMKDLDDSKKDFEWLQINELDSRLKFSYKDLKWTTDTNVYKPELRKEYQVIITIDVSEGLGLDYSVLNIFSLKNKPMELIEQQKHKFRNIVDFIQLEQIGIFRSNLISVSELAELVYCIVFEHFNSNNVKVVLEVNTYGYELLAHLPAVFEGNNDYGSSVFFRYKHRIDAIEEKIGLKVGENKNIMIKDYQERMSDRSIIVTNIETISEITTFIKHTTTSGNVKYEADGQSNDDCVMTIINLSSVFKKSEFRGMVEEYFDNLSDTEIKIRMNQILGEISYEEGVDYKQLLDIRKRRITSIRRQSEARRGWGL